MRAACLGHQIFLDLVTRIIKIGVLWSSRDSVVGVATGYWLDDRGVGIRVPLGQEFSLLHVVQTGSGTHPASYPLGTGGFAER
jgi:hypothetical protein